MRLDCIYIRFGKKCLSFENSYDHKHHTDTLIKKKIFAEFIYEPGYLLGFRDIEMTMLWLLISGSS